MKFFLMRPWIRIKGIYEDYPKPFWTLSLVTFIDAVGSALIFPFFSLYITHRFAVGMTEVGVLFGLFSLASMFGSVVGGALADRIGRKTMILSGLVISAASTLSMALAPSMEWFYLLAIFVGLFANLGGPARQAMVADLLRPELRVQGYGVQRVVMNLAVAIGPAIGGFIASKSYLFLFVADAVISFSVAVFVLRALPETRPMARANAAEEENLLQTLAGYQRVLRDRIFMLFISAGVLMMLVYMQMNTTLPVYLRDVHHISEQGYGLLLSLNAGMVVLFQFHISRKVNQRPAMLMMSLGALFQVFGFSMFGYASSYSMFILAMVIITMGEMIVEPVAQGLVARMSPDDMRGRYMAVFGFTYMISSMVGPFLAGLVIDHFDPRLLWYIAGVVGMLAVMIYFMLFRRSESEQSIEVQTTQAMD